MQAPESPLQFTILAELDCDVSKAADIMNNPIHMVRWVPTCKSARWEHPAGKLETGSVRYFGMKTGFTATEAITFFEAPGRLNYTVVTMGILKYSTLFKGYEGVTVLEPLADGRCRLSWGIHFYCTGIMKLFEPLAVGIHRVLIGHMVGNICKLAGGKRLN
jgi:hypothetical protein